MGRGRGKGKKTTVAHEDPGSGEEEKIPVQKRRGRPQKPLKDEINDQDIDKAKEDEEDNQNKDAISSSKEPNAVGDAAENGKKRKRNSPIKEKESPVKEENSAVATGATDGSIKVNGFRHVGSRRKNKPRRAAEVGVEC